MATRARSNAGLTKLERPNDVIVDDAPASSRKRRKRTQATGAADDCFACQERNTSCDRRRPYCSQCLEAGKDCSGYKTTLTWGVGVASRGKLRGLALPIAKSKKAEQSTDTSPDAITNPPPPLPTPPRLSTTPPKDPKDIPRSVPRSVHSQHCQLVDHGAFTSEDRPSSMLPPPSLEVQPPRPRKRARRHSLDPIQVPSVPAVQTYMPITADPTMGYTGQDYGISPVTPCFGSYEACSSMYSDLSPMEYKSMPQQVPITAALFENDFFLGHDASSWPRGSVSSTHSSDTEQVTDDDQFYVNPELARPIDGFLASQHEASMGGATTGHEHQDANHSGTILGYSSVPSLVMDDVGPQVSMPFPAQQLPSLQIGNTPKLRFLIDYYDRVISPVIVAFDGPTNPYRTHILQLAIESETLQHAIAALSASNLRMRRAQVSSEPRRRISAADCTYDESVRRSSIAFNMMDKGQTQSSAAEPSREELYHKSASIKGLNQQLADPTARKDDSILAALLMLCLYHICDTGVAKFQTQFAGVKKILALRGGTSGKNSKASNWLTIMFTWFDAMTAAVNDREGHLAGDDVDMSAFENEDWALENLAGCDSKLFKIIAKLGRLNLLSQSKKVRPSSPPWTLKDERRSSSPTAMTVSAGTNKSLDYYSMSAPRYDGNGWTQLLVDDDLPRDPHDTRTQFWTEWKSVRRALEDWQLDATTLNSPAMPASSPNAQSDRLEVFHISESFRYSALLYTERLAFPHLPSSHPNFSNLVNQALMHISTVQTDVFLLWPLFITGTECVSLEGRRMIRQRCMDIQRDSGFFNNITGLELLEKTWRLDEGGSEGELPVGGVGGGAGSPELPVTSSGAAAAVGRACGEESKGFKWRKTMEKKGEEYLVV